MFFLKGAYYDIHPIEKTVSGATFTSTSRFKYCNSNSFSTSVPLDDDDIVMFENVSGLSGSTFTNATFEGKKFMQLPFLWLDVMTLCYLRVLKTS